MNYEIKKKFVFVDFKHWIFFESAIDIYIQNEFLYRMPSRLEKIAISLIENKIEWRKNNGP